MSEQAHGPAAQSGSDCGEEERASADAARGQSRGQPGAPQASPAPFASAPGFAAGAGQAATAPGQAGMQSFGAAHLGGTPYAGGQALGAQQGAAQALAAGQPGPAAGYGAPAADGYGPAHGAYSGQQSAQFAPPMVGAYPYAGMGAGGPMPAQAPSSPMAHGGYAGMYAAPMGITHPPYAGAAGYAHAVAPGMYPGMGSGLGQGAGVAAPRGAGPQGAGMAQVFEEIANGGNGLSSIGKLLNFEDSEFWKGALVGAAAVLLLTNDSVQDMLFKTGVKAKDAVKSGAEKIKETAGEAAAKAKS